MKKLILIAVMLCAFPAQAQTPIHVPANPVQYVGTVRFDTISIRLVVLKHCFESIADADARDAIEAVNLAKSKGLSIKDVGNHHIDKDGQARDRVWSREGKQDLKEFISEQMKIDALPGDTFIVYTIGHGSGGGTLQYIGQRKILCDAIAQAAEENEQETLWWQLSCHAAAKLPKISDYNEVIQEYFSMLASSPADKVSYFRTQGEQMEKFFSAIATRSKDIDPNNDEEIVAKEVQDYLNNHISRGRGDLFFARSDEEVIFGYNLANSIPIVDRNNPQQEYPRNYIPTPRK